MRRILITLTVLLSSVTLIATASASPTVAPSVNKKTAWMKVAAMGNLFATVLSTGGYVQQKPQGLLGVDGTGARILMPAKDFKNAQITVNGVPLVLWAKTPLTGPTNPEANLTYCIAYPYGDGTRYAYTINGMGSPSYNTTGCPLGYPTVIPTSVKEPVSQTVHAFVFYSGGIFQLEPDGNLYGWKTQRTHAANPTEFDYIFAEPAATQITINGIPLQTGVPTPVRDDSYERVAYCVANPLGDGQYYRVTRPADKDIPADATSVPMESGITTEGCLPGVTAWN